MSRILLLIVLVFTPVLSAWIGEPEDSAKKKAIAEIETLGGTVIFDREIPAEPIIRVSLSDTHATDASLNFLRELTQLFDLNLSGTRVTDAGLEHLVGLSQLQNLNLTLTGVTGEGLKYLTGL